MSWSRKPPGGSWYLGVAVSRSSKMHEDDAPRQGFHPNLHRPSTYLFRRLHAISLFYGPQDGARSGLLHWRNGYVREDCGTWGLPNFEVDTQVRSPRSLDERRCNPMSERCPLQSILPTSRLTPCNPKNNFGVTYKFNPARIDYLYSNF